MKGAVELSNSIIWDNPSEVWNMWGDPTYYVNLEPVVISGSSINQQLYLENTNIEGGAEGVSYSGLR